MNWRLCSRRESGVGGRKGEREEIMKIVKEIKGLESVMWVGKFMYLEGVRVRGKGIIYIMVWCIN